MNAADLIAFEDEVAAHMAAGRIHTPTHLCGGNEEALIAIFEHVKPEDYVFASYRNHYHALLHGVPRERVMQEILQGRSMTPVHPGHRFFSSAIVAGTLPIAVGVAAAIKRARRWNKVWCFVGDMAATTGAFHEAVQYADGHDLPITFVIEDNGLSCDTPTKEVWGHGLSSRLMRYEYTRERPHLGAKH